MPTHPHSPFIGSSDRRILKEVGGSWPLSLSLSLVEKIRQVVYSKEVYWNKKGEKWKAEDNQPNSILDIEGKLKRKINPFLTPQPSLTCSLMIKRTQLVAFA